MKYIQFKKLHIRNFLSVGDEGVDVTFNKGLNIITGINRDKEDRRNGVGKSTIADAIYFAVFGNTIRELKKENIINNITQKNCEVVLDFTIVNNNQKTEYKIVRTLGPTKCHFYINDKDETRDSISNTSELISKTINSSQDIFQNCVIMTINNTIPFMAKRKLDKRKFIESIFNLQVFSSMLNEVRSKYSDVSKDFHVECARYEETSNTLVSYNKQKTDHVKHKQQQHEILNERKKQNDEKIKQNNSKLSEINIIDENQYQGKIDTLSEAREKVRKSITQFQAKDVELSTKVDILNERIDGIGTREESCPVCLRPITDHDHKHIQEEKEKLISEKNQLIETREQTMQKKHELEEKITAIKNAIKKLESQVYKNNLNKQEIVNIKNNINHLNELNGQISEDIKKINDDYIGVNDIIKTTENKLNEVQNTIDTLKKRMNVYDIVKFIVSEEGVKSYIVKKILQLFNSKLAYYLKKMDANCICVFNEYFEEQIIDEKGKICSYFNFSGAERKNIDLACLFAFMDIRRLQGDVAFNFSIYDELFDSSLDERGVDLVTEILKERVEKYNECIMVISHRKESIKNATGEIIFLEKKNGITSRITPVDTIN